MTSCIHNWWLRRVFKKTIDKNKARRPAFKILKPFSVHLKTFLSFKGKPEALYRSVCFLPNKKTQIRWDGNKKRKKKQRKDRRRKLSRCRCRVGSVSGAGDSSVVSYYGTVESLRSGQEDLIRQQQGHMWALIMKQHGASKSPRCTLSSCPRSKAADR